MQPSIQEDSALLPSGVDYLTKTIIIVGIKGYLEAQSDKAKLLKAQIMKDTSLHNYAISSIVDQAKGL